VSTTPPKLNERRPDSQQLVRQWALLRLLADASDSEAAAAFDDVPVPQIHGDGLAALRLG
jgi:hypothetical protein